MVKTLFHLSQSTLVFLLTLLFVVPLDLRAAQHVIDDSDLHNAIVRAKELRKNHIHQVNNFLSQKDIKHVLAKSSIDVKKLQQATAQLTDEELSRIASRSLKIQNDFSAGHLSNRELTILVVALAFAILIVAVAN